MKLIKDSAIDIISNDMLSFFNIKEYKDIITFALQDVDLSGDVSSAKDKIDLENYPYMIQPLKNCVIEDNVRKEVVIAWPEQFGKSLIQMVALLYNSCYNTLQAIICYPSIDLATETALVKFVPLFKSIEQFKDDIEKPFAIRGDRFKLSNAIIYWQGAGSKVVSKSCKLVLADEAAIFETPNNVNNLNELKKRTRSYNECLQLFVSTPRYKEDNFWRQFLAGSQGFYTLRCCNCGELTMRSCDIFNLQFETVYNQQLKQYVAVRGSERLICPQCRYQHKEEEKQQMIKQGQYIHRYTDKIKEHPTYQAGVLASMLNVHSWSNIADIQLASGKEATLEDYISFDNSIRGLPYQMREYNKQSESALQKHYFKLQELKKEDIEAVFISADTQDAFSVVCVIALTKQNNYYVIDMGRLRYLWLEDEERAVINAENKRNNKQPQITLLDMMDNQYYGFKPLCMLVDYRGHRANQIKNFSMMRKNILMYGGTNLRYDKWKISQNVPKLFLCDAKKFQSQLLFMLYFNNNKEANYLFLPQDITEKDIQQITSFQPDNEKRNGNMLQNWTPKDKVHDMFDAVKMGIACIQIASRIYRKDKFAHGEARILNPINKPQHVKKAQKKPIKTVERRSVFKRY